MKPHTARLLLWAGALALLAQACSGAPPERKQENPERFVRLESRAGEPRSESVAPFAHPLRLSPADWTRLLSTVRIQSRKDSFLPTLAKEPPADAFTQDEIGYLSRALSETFAVATPEQRVVFGMSRALPSGVTEITTGGLFAEGARLHLLLANYRQSVNKAGLREQMWNEPLRSVSAPYYEVAPAEGQSVMPGKGLFSGLRNVGPDIALDYRALLTARPPAPVAAPVPAPALPSPPAPMVPTPVPAPAESVTKPPSIPEVRIPPAAMEEHLRTLKRLRELDLITEEEYRQKKKDILDRF